MEFYIKKNATLPLLKMSVVKDGRSDFRSFMEDLENYAIYFTMYDVKSGVAKIVNAPADIVSTETENEYYIYYQFKERDTKTTGRYKGEFLLKNTQGDLILPLREELYINVLDSNLKQTKCC
jgi:predicted transcriptional regulator